MILLSLSMAQHITRSNDTHTRTHAGGTHGHTHARTNTEEMHWLPPCWYKVWNMCWWTPSSHKNIKKIYICVGVHQLFLKVKCASILRYFCHCHFCFSMVCVCVFFYFCMLLFVCCCWFESQNQRISCHPFSASATTSYYVIDLFLFGN